MEDRPAPKKFNSFAKLKEYSGHTVKCKGMINPLVQHITIGVLLSRTIFAFIEQSINGSKKRQRQ